VEQIILAIYKQCVFDESKINILEQDIKMFETYLPTQLSIDEVKLIIDNVVAEIKNAGKGIGDAMKLLSKELKGKVNMKEVKKRVDEKFN